MSISFTDLDPAPVLVDLEARAGASDKDRPAWLAQRAGGCAATELAKIMIASNREVAIADLVKMKREGDSFTGNAFTDWGNEREPIIAAKLAGYGVMPESRVFHAADDSRHLASPDGLSVDFDGNLILDEIKTSGKPLLKGSRDLEEKGYEWQMQWGNRVTGAIGCWLNVEQRHGRPGAFSVGEMTREWFPRDEAMIAELIEVADQVLAAMDADAVPVINEEVDTHAVNYLRALDEGKKWEVLKKTSYDALIKLGISQESALARVTITPAKPGAVSQVDDVDEAKARRARGGKAAFEAVTDARTAVAEAQSILDAAEAALKTHCARFTTTRTVVGNPSKARATVTAGKGTK